MKIRIVKGAMKIHSKGDIVFHTFDGDMEFNAQGKNIWHGEKGNEVGKYEYIETQEDTAVTEIECVTELDDGSSNDGTGVNTQKGVLYNNTYVFRVKEFSNGTPKNHRSIKWKISYTDPETNIYEDNILEDKAYRGRELRVTFTSNAHCGGNLEVKAFISDDKTEGLFPVFMHNRFRWFDREILKKDTKERMYTGENINQGDSSICGVAVIGYFLAIQKPKEYEKLVLELHRKGEVTVSSTNYRIILDEDEHLTKVKETDVEYPKKMSYADFIFLFSIKDYLNNIFDYDPDGPNAGGIIEGGTGLTLPNEVESMMKHILNYNSIKDETNLITSKWQNTYSSVEELKYLLENGYSISLLIDVDNFINKKKSAISYPKHWVGLNDIFVDTVNEKISVKVFTWGITDKLWTVSFDVFKDGYYGYVAGK